MCVCVAVLLLGSVVCWLFIQQKERGERERSKSKESRRQTESMNGAFYQRLSAEIFLLPHPAWPYSLPLLSASPHSGPFALSLSLSVSVALSLWGVHGAPAFARWLIRTPIPSPPLFFLSPLPFSIAYSIDSPKNKITAGLLVNTSTAKNRVELN